MAKESKAAKYLRLKWRPDKTFSPSDNVEAEALGWGGKAWGKPVAAKEKAGGGVLESQLLNSPLIQPNTTPADNTVVDQPTYVTSKFAPITNDPTDKENNDFNVDDVKLINTLVDDYDEEQEVDVKAQGKKGNFLSQWNDRRKERKSARREETMSANEALDKKETDALEKMKSSTPDDLIAEYTGLLDKYKAELTNKEPEGKEYFKTPKYSMPKF
jgi:hypothetical protein